MSAAVQLPSNPRGIPKAPFVDSVPRFLADSNAETLLKKVCLSVLDYDVLRLQESVTYHAHCICMNIFVV